MASGLAHVCYIVKDLEKSIEFYCDSLGLKHAFDFINDEGKRYGVYLLAGGRTFLEFFQGKVGEEAKGQSYSHLCLEVDNLQATVQKLRAQNIEVTDPKLELDQSWQAWLADPDGNRIELHEYTEESWQIKALK